MDLLRESIVWLNDPLNWTNPGGVVDRTREHLLISAVAVLLGCLVAWPLGIWLGHVGRGGLLVVAVANLTRAVPTVALLVIFPLTVIGSGQTPIIVALAVFAVPPLLANAYVGMREVDPQVRDAAVGMGLSDREMITRVELPLAVPYLAAGLRTAAVQVVATAALAAFVNGGGLGSIISRGFGLGLASGGDQVIAGALLIIVLCLVVEGSLAVAQWAVTPQPLRRAGRRPTASAADAPTPSGATTPRSRST